MLKKPRSGRAEEKALLALLSNRFLFIVLVFCFHMTHHHLITTISFRLFFVVVVVFCFILFSSSIFQTDNGYIIPHHNTDYERKSEKEKLKLIETFLTSTYFLHFITEIIAINLLPLFLWTNKKSLFIFILITYK